MLQIINPYPKSIVRCQGIQITGANGTIVQDVAVQGKTSQPTFVLGYTVTETTATKQNNAQILITVDSTNIIQNQSVVEFLNQAGTPISEIKRFQPLLVDLGTGSQLKVGHLSGATLSVLWFNVYFVYTNDRDNKIAG